MITEDGFGVTIEYRYLDVIWLDNLIMNFLMLWTVWKLSKNTASMWRLWLSAFIGAAYAIVLLLPGFYLLASLPFKLILSLTMILIGFRILTFKDLLKLLGFFYGITFLFGGAAFGLYYFFGANIDIGNGVFFIKDFPVKLLIFSALFIILLYRWLWPVIQFRLNHEGLIYKTEVWFDDKSVIFDAFLDTGNELKDPISGTPVMVVEYEQAKAALPPEVQTIFVLSMENNLEFITRTLARSNWISRCRMVPYNTLNNSNGIMIAFKPDKARIEIKGRSNEIKDVIIGVRNQKLSKDNQYNAFIQPQILP